MMMGHSSRERAIIRVNILSLLLLGALFGLIAGLVSLVVIQINTLTADFRPVWIELQAAFLSVRRPYPVEAWLIGLWPAISAAVNAIVAALLGLLYNVSATLVGPLRIELSD